MVVEEPTCEPRQEESTEEFPGEEGRAGAEAPGSEWPGVPAAGRGGAGQQGSREGTPGGCQGCCTPSLLSGVQVGGSSQGFGQRDAHNVPLRLVHSVTSDMDLQNGVVRTAFANRE